MSITVSGTLIGRNRTSMASHLMFPAQHTFWNSPASRTLAQQMPIKSMRLTETALNSGNSGLCTSWNATSHTGTYDWRTFDATLALNKQLGIPTLLVLGFVDSTNKSAWTTSGGTVTTTFKPIGTWRSNTSRGTASTNMPIDATTLLPSPADYAQYVKEIVQHIKDMGFNVPYYELVNEPQFYFYPNWSWNSARAGYFLAIYNAAYDAVKSIQPTALCGNDSALYAQFLSYWKQNGGRLDFLSGHKYDSFGKSSDDAQGLDYAEGKFFQTGFNSIFITVPDARTFWGNLDMPVFFTEANWSAAFSSGTDPRIFGPVGQAWCGIVAMNCIREGVDALHYFDWCSSTSYETSQYPDNYGFGMINLDDGVPREPYNLLKGIFSNISVDDEVLATTVTGNSNIRAQVWRHNGAVNCLIVNRGSAPATVTYAGQTYDFPTYGAIVVVESEGLSLPYASTFADLASNWQTVNGAWSVS